MKPLLFSVTAAVLLVPGVGSSARFQPERKENSAPAQTSPGPLSPCALAATPDGAKLFIACATAGQVLVWDARVQEVEQRLAVPESPSGLALSPDGSRLYVTCAAAESVVCIFNAKSGRRIDTIPAAHTAMAPVVSPDGKTLYVCDRFNDALAVIDLRARKEVTRIPVEREPVAAALNPEGTRLVVANHLPTGRSDTNHVAGVVNVLDPRERRLLKRIALPNGSTLLRGICVSPDGAYAAVTHTLSHFLLPPTGVAHGWMNANALSLIDLAELKLLNTVLLDEPEQGAGNPWAVAWSPDGRFIIVTHAGTHELSVIDARGLLEKLWRLPVRFEPEPNARYDSTARTVADVPNDLNFLQGLRQRVKCTEKGPRALAISGSRALVGSYFSDSLTLVALDGILQRGLAGAALETQVVKLGPALEPSLARQGELYFNDASICHLSWQSCASCHSSDGRVDGLNWDLQNDGIGNPKNVKSLLLCFQTPPVMSLGVRADAAAAIRAGIKYTLFSFGPQPYAPALDEYVKSLRPLPSPHLVKGRLSAAAQRGKKLFFGSAGCAGCHRPPLYTDLKPHAVGTRKFDQSTDEFYTPTLIEAWRTAPYLHDGSAVNMREAIRQHHSQPLPAGGPRLDTRQLEDLEKFVLSL